MKRIFYIVILVIINLLLLISCQENCPDNISSENKKVPYKNNDVVQFENDTLGIVNDTVFVDLQMPGKYLPSSGDDDSDACGCISTLSYSNLFVLGIGQGINLYGNVIGFQYVGQSNYDYVKSVEINFSYKNEKVKAYKGSYYTDTLGAIIWKINVSKDSTFVYNDYIYMTDPEIKLLQYTTVYRDGTRRVWRLQE